jgi:hypothetical protein
MEKVGELKSQSHVVAQLRRNLEEIKRVGNLRLQTLLAAAPQESGSPVIDTDSAKRELKKSGPTLLLNLVELRRNHRVLHRQIEAKGSEVVQVRDQLETISNFHEGIIYQKNNIEREIFNCRKGTLLPNLDKIGVSPIVEHLEELGKRKSATQSDLQTLDSVGFWSSDRKSHYSWPPS